MTRPLPTPNTWGFLFPRPPLFTINYQPFLDNLSKELSKLITTDLSELGRIVAFKMITFPKLFFFSSAPSPFPSIIYIFHQTTCETFEIHMERMHFEQTHPSKWSVCPQTLPILYSLIIGPKDLNICGRTTPTKPGHFSKPNSYICQIPKTL